MTDKTTPSPDHEPPAEGETLGEEVAHVVESAAELGLGAVIAPFTGGETVSIVGSVASMLEAGVDRLTHPGERESPPELDEDGQPIRPVPDTYIPDSGPGNAPDDGRE